MAFGIHATVPILPGHRPETGSGRRRLTDRMPFLRFSRDKRGYANTYLCHTFREDGVVRMRVLYWFRTPPDIEVGRGALDAEAIRDIEASNPDLTFDWDEIMKAKPLPPARDPAGGEARERRSRRRGRGSSSGSGGRASGVAAGAQAVPSRTVGGSRDASDAAATGSAPGAGEAESLPDPSPARRRRRRRRRGGGGAEGRAAPAGASVGASPAGEPDSDPA